MFLIVPSYMLGSTFYSGMIDKADQLAPLYIMDVFSSVYPGLAGLFIACVCSASLSTISSGLNALAAVFLQDVVKAFWSPNISDARAASLSKGDHNPSRFRKQTNDICLAEFRLRTRTCNGQCI